MVPYHSSLGTRTFLNLCRTQRRLHDCRARNVIEAIMWHGASNSDARWSIDKFRELSKEDRDAIVKFIDAI